MLIDLLDGALADRADFRALDSLTFRQFHDGALRVARHLAERDVGQGDRVAIYCENRHAFALTYVAALRLGAIAVPINVLYRASDLSHVLGDAEPAAILCSRQSLPFLSESGCSVLHVLDAHDVEARASDARTEPLPAHQRPAPEDIALIVYTSGTTGRSKGAMLSHRNVAAIASQLVSAWRWRAEDCLLLTLPLFHVHGLIAGLTTSLCAGSRIVLHERFDAHAVLERLAEGDVSMFFGVPTMYVRLIEHAASRAIPPIRLFVSGSAALSVETFEQIERRFGARILERYGATEFGFPLGNPYAGPRVAGSVGVPMPGVRVRIAAPGEVRATASGEIGELLVAGPNVFAGYWRQPEATAAAFTLDDDGTRWYRSGDLARFDPEDDVYRIVGRIKEVIITGGFNVYPAEVESAIERFPNVRGCAVVGKPDPARGELPIAFVEADGAIDVEAMLAQLRARLASFKIPKEIRVVETLPRNAMGKLDKPALRERL
jgi:malonyl-CoA/methylmalonyl-CoA synthetase